MKEFFNVIPVRKGQFEFFDYLIPEFIKDKEDMQYAGAVNSKGYPSGILAFKPGFEITTVEFIGVLPKERRKGVAETLIRALIVMLEGSNITAPIEIMWSEEDDEIMRPLISKLPEFYITEDDSVLNISAKVLAESEKCKKLKSFKKNTNEFFSLPPIEKKSVINCLKQKNLDIFLPKQEDCLMDLCLCALSQDKVSKMVSLDSIILFEKEDTDTLLLSFLYVSENNPMALGVVLGEALRRMDSRYPGMGMSMDLVNNKSKELARGIFGNDIKRDKLYTAIRFGKT